MTQPTRTPKVLLLVTGGTISSRRDFDGAAVATDRAKVLLDDLRESTLAWRIENVAVEAHDVMLVGSYLMTPGDMVDIARSIATALLRDDIDGIVVSHGTDTMEETAFLADLFHDDPRPVVFTGAQRAADVSDSDGPRNLIDAITIAGSPAARNLGVLISFNGEVFAAFGTRKTHTLALSAFTADGGRIGHIWNGTFTLRAVPRRAEPLDLSALHHEDTRVDLVPYYPGADVTALDAVVAAGSAAVVIEGTGAGNLNGPFCEKIASLTARGIIVALTTRVAYGPVAAIYGAGGGVDAVAAGAVTTGALRASQARILLFALLATGHSVDEVREEMTRRASQNALSSREAAPTDRPIERMRG